MAFIINQSQQVTGHPSQEVQDVLIVPKVDVIPRNAFLLVLLLFQLEDVANEELLQLLVGKINAQLLEAVQRRGDICLVLSDCSAAIRLLRMMCEEMSWPVCFEVLKAKDIKQADGQEGGFGAFGHPLIDDTVDFPNDPYEQLIVDCLKDQKQVKFNLSVSYRSK